MLNRGIILARRDSTSNTYLKEYTDVFKKDAVTINMLKIYKLHKPTHVTYRAIGKGKRYKERLGLLLDSMDIDI